MKFLIAGLLICLATVKSQAAQLKYDEKTGVYTGFVKVRNDKELYVKYVPPVKKEPTVILLNGLTYSTVQFDKLADNLIDRGMGVLRFDWDGMGETLLKYGGSGKPYDVKNQVADLKVLVEKLEIKGPLNLVGLSYGGGVGAGFALAHPKMVKNLILIAPYTEPLEGQDKWIRAQIWATRKMFPYNPASDDELYDYFLRQIIYATYPQAEPIVLENPFKLEAIYNLVRGIRKFRPVDHAHELPAGKVHLIVAGRDQYIPRGVMDNFWDKTNPEAKMSRILIEGVEHKINEVVPNFTAGWIEQIVRGNELLFEGYDFVGNPHTGTVRSGNRVITIDKEN